MKKYIFFLSWLFLATSTGLFGYSVEVYNTAKYPAEVELHYKDIFCSDDKFRVDPGTIKKVGVSLCCVGHCTARLTGGRLPKEKTKFYPSYSGYRISCKSNKFIIYQNPDSTLTIERVKSLPYARAMRVVVEERARKAEKVTMNVHIGNGTKETANVVLMGPKDKIRYSFKLAPKKVKSIDYKVTKKELHDFKKKVGTQPNLVVSCKAILSSGETSIQRFESPMQGKYLIFQGKGLSEGASEIKLRVKKVKHFPEGVRAGKVVSFR